MGQRAEYDWAGFHAKPFEGELAKVLESEFSEQFIHGMRSRMIVSFYKYGHLADAYPERVDALKCLEQRVQRYRETGNAEWLMDVANFAMMEFMHPKHPDAHFRPTDSDESPGRIRTDGQDAHGKNVPVDAAVEKLKAKFDRGD